MEIQKTSVKQRNQIHWPLAVSVLLC